MRNRLNSALNICLFLALLMSAGGAVPAWGGNGGVPAPEYFSNYGKQETEWKRVNPPGEEFSILTPVEPTLIELGKDYLVFGSDEKVLMHRSYSGYSEGFIFAIESYRASEPKRIFNTLSNALRPKKNFESEPEISGFSGKQYRILNDQFYGKQLSFVTRRHVYLITVASLTEDNAAVARFLSSLLLGDKITVPATGQVLDVNDLLQARGLGSGGPDALEAQGQIFSSKEVSRRAFIVWWQDPQYTNEARRDKVHGTVVLRCVFGADGRLSNVKVVSGLKDGLTEKALEAALCLRFFPAEKDGRPVSQYIQIEYNFNLY
ncbi:MAG TPA: energy transducer TonB [Pyrinomonadaceae bacterium]|nr:energy transducer TonB [Pyrinomonadaceae bacterium]